IRYQAYHDLLTGLPNRNLFNDHLSLAIAHARRTDQSLAVMFLDIDRFKLINDNFGHARGDDLLKSTGARLRNCLREGDTVARVGGDEFIILVSGVGAKRDVQKVASKIVKELRRPFSLEGREIFTSGSLGIALYPDDGDTMELLIKHADVAMYHMKDKGRDGFEFYDSEMNLRIANYLSLESSMRKGLEDGEFCLHYQPQVNMRSGGRVGVEALLRWNHPVRGLLLPSEFIPHAEESGLIVPIGQWVIEQVTEDIETWRKMGITPVKVAINLSALQFEQSNLVDEIITRFEGDESRQLEVEITENVIMKDVDDVVDKLVRLNRHGISVAVDDFGTGYSSLSYLHKLPIDTLKIDRAFVSDVGGAKHDSTIVRAIVAMAKGLGLNIIAEGVESRAQADYLLSQDCDIMQGYYFGAPMAADRTGQLFDPGRRLELA
ncbi:MAG: EAL domain-containing protein, partial [Proteobacteria bacterium]